MASRFGGYLNFRKLLPDYSRRKQDSKYVVKDLPFPATSVIMSQGETLGAYAVRCHLGMFDSTEASSLLPVYRSRVQRMLSYAQKYDDDHWKLEVPISLIFFPLSGYKREETPVLNVSDGVFVMDSGPSFLGLKRTVQCLVKCD